MISKQDDVGSDGSSRTKPHFPVKRLRNKERRFSGSKGRFRISSAVLLELIMFSLALFGCDQAQYLDSALNTSRSLWYLDSDQDGYGQISESVAAINAPGGYCAYWGDCDDEDPSIHPRATEVCNGLDDDCDSIIDENLTEHWYPDQDLDGYGTKGDSVEACEAPEGYVFYSGDCDDLDPDIHPGAAEVCDSADNDCDGETDEGPPSLWYRDDDGDGFGSSDSILEQCDQPAGYVLARGDCHDADPAVHPGAIDFAGDGLDSDCGGFDDRQPRVGFELVSAPSIQAALDASNEGEIIWVGPGVYPESAVSYHGKAVTLISTLGASSTRIDAIQNNRVMTFEESEGADSILDGFTLSGGYSRYENGGGIYFYYTRPTIRNCIIQDNEAEYGGGLFFFVSKPLLEDCLISQNHAIGGGGSGSQYGSPTLIGVKYIDNQSDYGAAMEFNGGSPVIRDGIYSGNTGETNGGAIFFKDATGAVVSGTTFSENAAPYGGAIYAENTELQVESSTFNKNRSDNYGGALALYQSDISFNKCTFTDNSAKVGGALYSDNSTPDVAECLFSGNSAAKHGGAVYLNRSDPNLRRDTFVSNSAARDGGAIYMYGSKPVLSNCLFAQNRADSGGALSVNDSSPTFVNNTVIENQAWNGGALFVEGEASHPSITNSIFAYNRGGNLYNEEGSLSISYCDVFNYGTGNEPALNDETNIFEEPSFVDYSRDWSPGNDVLYLKPNSPLKDAGAPGYLDPDGSRADIGMYGGSAAAFDFYSDEDEDGMYDGWELHYDLDPGSDDGQSDADQDGATNLDEFQIGADPLNTDCDGDGYMDGAELLAGSDPFRWSSQPEKPDPLPMRVPEDVPTLSEAIELADSDGIIDLGPGVWTGSLELSFSGLSIIGRAGSESTVIEGDGLNAFWVVQSSPYLSGLTVTGGEADYAAGLDLWFCKGLVEDVRLEGNTAYYDGGGGRLYQSETTFDSVSITGNTAGESGGGLLIKKASPTIEMSSIRANHAHSGGGIRLDEASPTMRNVEIANNLAEYQGGAVYADSSSPSLSNCSLAGNQAKEGGGIFLQYSATLVRNTILKGNSASSQGGAAYIYHADLSFINSIIANNTASDGGGLYLWAMDSPPFANSILAYNLGGNMATHSSSDEPDLIYTVAYNPMSFNTSENAWLPPQANTEPHFLSYDAEGRPVDFHLALDSPLINAGETELEFQNVDGSRNDIGAYGGPYGGSFDLDTDAYPDYFWPGTIDDAPIGYHSEDYDADDHDSSAQ